MRLYFGHPVNTYNTPVEDAVIELIRYHFPGVEIDNPNTPEYQERYDKLKESTGGTHGAHRGMDVFYETIKDDDGCVALPFLDGRMGLGVAGEAQKTLVYGKTVWLIEPSHELSEAELAEFVKDPRNGAFKIRELNEYEKAEFLRHSDLKASRPAFVVPHEETRLRTFMQYNGPARPYAKAHIVPVPSDFYALVPKK